MDDTNIAFEIESNFLSETPDVVATPSQISYPSAPDFRRLDFPDGVICSFDTGLHLNDQFNHIRILTKYIEDTHGFIPFLYSYRSVIGALTREESIRTAMAGSRENPDGKGVDLKALTRLFKEFFEPKFTRFDELRSVCDSIVKSVAEIIKTDKYEPSDVIFEKLVELFDLVFNIEQLKLLKTGISNDFSFYNREKRRQTLNPQDPGIADSQKLQQFLAMQNYTLFQLRNEILPKVVENQMAPRSYAFLSQLLEYCIKQYKHEFLVPKEKTAIIVTIVCVLYIHSSNNPILNIFASPSIHQVFEILHENPVVPLYGENSFVPGFVLQKSEGLIYDKSFPIALSPDDIKKKEDQYLLKTHMDRFRTLYRDNLNHASKMARNGSVTLEGLVSLLSCLSEMTLAIQKQSSLKFIITAPKPQAAKPQAVKPADPKPNENTNDEPKPREPVPSPADGQPFVEPYKYDLAIKLNYTHEDLNSLAELIGYVKSLSSTTLIAEPVIQKFVLNHVNSKVQQFVKNALERPLVRANSAEDEQAVRLLEVIRNVFGEWNASDPNANLPKKTKLITPHIIEEKLAVPTHNQLDNLRVIISSLITDNSPFRNSGIFRWSHFRPKHVKLSKQFLEESKDWYHLLDYAAVLRDATNLGFLWFRETSLDMDKVLQFPVRSSLPFILAEHLLQVSSKPALHDSVFFPFELYNDAAAQAIKVYDSQYLYREIEAEADLCVNMIAFSFSEIFYRFCRETAAAMELPPECVGRLNVMPMRYSVMVQQNKMELLGSAVDFNNITTNKLNLKMQKELETYLEMLNDIRMAPIVAHLIRVVRTTHSLLVENHLLMDDFDILWQKACGSDKPLSIESKISTRITSILDFPHIKLNSVSRRFLHGKPISLEAKSNDPWWKEYILLHKHEMNYIGVEHIRAICELLSPGELSHIIQVCASRLESNLVKIIEVYTQIAPNIRLLPPMSKDDTVGFYNFNSDAYSSLSHPQLGKLFDLMRAFGNIISFMWFLDNELPPSRQFQTIMAPLMTSIKQTLLEQKGLFFGEGPLNLESIQSHRSFASLWSVLEFLICSPRPIKLGESGNTVQPLEAFGDGLPVCAHAIISLCDQVSLYKLDSICYRALELERTEHSKIPKNDLNQFNFHASVVDQARKFAELVTSPFKINRQDC